ncbi:hypothetical protein [Microbacterium rhizosphaerae]|uniref:DUF308 domain-containing protein n=1 Tax=Microbacterium rhizosphaerae TaxID=1678237 RepID=A0ABZ0SNM6_9MICO|nr:hypothetical protein [Microbacterium rhizosphaerae]WPR90956.1 hypothetical protein SM116_06590 [Microbacterium rhizosphaerae]
MKRLTVRIALGVLVLLAGILMLLEALHVPLFPAAWAVVSGAAGLTFGYVFVTERRSWWAAIPAGALLGVATATLMDLDQGGLAQWTRVPLLAGISVGFWAVYLRDHSHWWSLIPAGILLTLSIVSALPAAVGAAATGAIFLLGAALTFVLVAVAPAEAGRRWWAWFPAGALAISALAVLASAAQLLTVVNVLWPLAVIGAGAFLVWRAIRARHDQPDRQDSGAPVDHTSEGADQHAPM